MLLLSSITTPRSICSGQGQLKDGGGYSGAKGQAPAREVRLVSPGMSIQRDHRRVFRGQGDSSSLQAQAQQRGQEAEKTCPMGGCGRDERGNAGGQGNRRLSPRTPVAGHSCLCFHLLFLQNTYCLKAQAVPQRPLLWLSWVPPRPGATEEGLGKVGTMSVPALVLGLVTEASRELRCYKQLEEIERRWD